MHVTACESVDDARFAERELAIVSLFASFSVSDKDVTSKLRDVDVEALV